MLYYYCYVTGMYPREKTGGIRGVLGGCPTRVRRVFATVPAVLRVLEEGMYVGDL